MTKEECEIETSKAIMEMRTYVAKLEKEKAKLQEKLNIRSCQNCKHNNKSCPNGESSTKDLQEIFSTHIWAE